MGGDQWPYVQLLKGTVAAQRISDKSNNATMALGGTSAGMAILANYVFTAEFIRANSGDATALQSVELLNNYKDTDFFQSHPSIDQNVLAASALSGFVTETHFTDSRPAFELTGGYKIGGTQPTYRLGRFLTFLGSVLPAAPDGLGRDSVNGLAIDDNTAIGIARSGIATGTAKVYSGEDPDIPAKHVYFAKTDYATSNVGLVLNPADGTEPLNLENVYFRWFDVGDSFTFATDWQTDPLHFPWYCCLA